MSIVSVITTKEEAGAFLRWGNHFAKALGTDLVALCTIADTQAEEVKTVSLDEENENPLLEKIRREAIDLTPRPTIRVLRGKKYLKGVLAVASEVSASLLIIGRTELQEDLKDDVSLTGDLLKKTTCDVLMLRTEETGGQQCKRVLVPVGEGEHSRAAIHLAGEMAEDEELRVRALFIEQEVGPDARDVGRRVLDRVIQKAGVSQESRLEREVLLDDNVTNGIVRAADVGYDLILLGASRLSVIRRRLFGTIPERLLREQEIAIGVVYAAPPLTTVAKTYMVQFFERYIPQMERADRVDLFERLQSGSKAGFNFLTLIALSTAIAALGLIQNSPAVVIGAMLVAPLMTPMLGAGLGLVQGNILLVRETVRSIFLGFLTSLVIGLVFGLSIPGLHKLTNELLARGSPNLLDLVVALLSGMAAAYALARPGLLEALPGVAIAAALVPPIATVGVSLALGEWQNAKGAAMLFGINLLAIILASAFAFYILGVRPSLEESRPRLWARRILLLLCIVAVGIAFPLGTPLFSQVTNQNKKLYSSLKRFVSKQTGLRLRSVKMGKEGEKALVTLEVVSASPLSRRQAMLLREVVHTVSKKPIKVVVRTRLEWDFAAKRLSPPVQRKQPKQRARAQPPKRRTPPRTAGHTPQVRERRPPASRTTPKSRTAAPSPRTTPKTRPAAPRKRIPIRRKVPVASTKPAPVRKARASSRPTQPTSRPTAREVSP